MLTELFEIELENSCKSVFVDDAILLVSSNKDNINCTYGASFSKKTKIGCFSKIITSTVIVDYFSKHENLLSTPINNLNLKSNLKLSDELTLTHLLSQTHGIDDTNFDFTYKDFVQNIHKFNFSTLFPPGKFTQTGVLGNFIALNIFEELTGLPFTKHLENFFLNNNIDYDPSILHFFCPSRGGKNFIFPINSILQIIEWYFSNDGENCFSLLSKKINSFRNWSFDFFDTCIGFTHFGSNWYGSNSYIGNGSLVVRFNPILQTVILVSSTSIHAYRIYRDLFSKNIPELRGNRSFPKILENYSINSFNALLGKYENCSFSYIISLDKGKLILIRADKYDSNKATYTLIPCTDDIFFTKPSTTNFSFIEFHTVMKPYDKAFIWDGLNVTCKVL